MLDADLVAVEVVGLLAAFAVFASPVMYLCQGFVRTAHTLRRDWKFHVVYGLLQIITNSIFVQNLKEFVANSG